MCINVPKGEVPAYYRQKVICSLLMMFKKRGLPVVFSSHVFEDERMLMLVRKF